MSKMKNSVRINASYYDPSGARSLVDIINAKMLDRYPSASLYYAAFGSIVIISGLICFDSDAEFTMFMLELDSSDVRVNGAGDYCLTPTYFEKLCKNE